MNTKTRKEIIDETAALYNSTNRAVVEGKCVLKDNEGNKCAVGRCMMDHYLNDSTPTTGPTHGFDKFLKPEYLGHKDMFWVDLQELHDADRYWDEKGLTRTGQDYVASLHRLYDET